MGLVKQIWMEQQEQDYLDEKAEWIRDKLGDPDADEFTEGWDQLSDEFESHYSESVRNVYEDDWQVIGKSRIEIFDENIAASREVLNLSLTNSTTKNLLVMLHAHVVTSVEAYLSSTFIEKALSSESLMQKLVETDPEFASRKFSIREIFNKRQTLKDDLRQYLKDLIFHDIAKVKKMYKSVLNIDFGEIPWLFCAVVLRHDCVHRAGYDKEGNEAPLTKNSIKKLIDQCEKLVHFIELSVESIPDAEDFFWKKDNI